MSKTKIIRNKTLKEYKDTYPNYKDLEKHTIEEVNKNKDLLKDNTWWLIDNTYYEAKDEKKKNAIAAWWSNLGKGARTTICVLGGAAVITGITVPTVFAVKSCTPSVRKIIVNGEVTHTSEFKADGSLKATINPTDPNKEISKLDIKIGDYTLKENEYSFTNNELNISADVIKAHKGNVVITATLVDKGPKITSVTITNVNTSVGVNNKLELTAKVLPEDATDKDVSFTITDGDDYGEIEINAGRSYLKGVAVGTVKVQAYATHAPEIKSEEVEFSVVNLYKIDWNTTNINDSTHGFVDNKTLYGVAKTATTIEFSKSASTDGAPVGESGSTNLIYASYVSSTKKLSIWSDCKIAFNENDMIVDGTITGGPFWYCSAATTITLNNIDTNGLTSMAYMFNMCTNLKSLNLSSFDTCNVTNMDNMFCNCSNLTNINLSSFNTKNVNNMDSMFGDCIELTSLDLSKFDTSNVTNMPRMFEGCVKIESLDLSSFNTSKVTDMCYMFSYNWNDNTMAIKSIIFGNKFDTSKVEYMYNMFDGCSELTSLNLSSFDTSKVIDMTSMFDGCKKITSLDLSKFDTSKVTDMSNMFNDCQQITSLDLSKFDTSKVTKMNNMFNGCKQISSLNLSTFDTSEVTNMNNMFKDCQQISSLNLSTFNFENVKYTSQMFSGCSALTTINVKEGTDLSIAPLTQYNNMFSGCTNLKGGQGTTCDGTSHIDNEYARIDGGSTTPGYFTKK